MQTLIYFLALLATIKALTTDLLPSKGECGVFTSDRLLGSIVTDIDAFPWTVRLEFEKGNKTKFLCGGVLISKRYVLTQAYCIKKSILNWKLKSVRLGEFNTTSEIDCYDTPISSDCADPPIDISVEEELVHEHYEVNNIIASNDIALLRLSRDVQFTQFILPICLPKDKFNYDGKALVVSGWGKTYDNNNPEVKLEFTLTGMINVECTKRYKKRFHDVIISDGQLCAVGSNTFCSGSGGNPLVVFRRYSYQLVGTESFATACSTIANHRLPTIFTNILYYMDWIISHIKA